MRFILLFVLFLAGCGTAAPPVADSAVDSVGYADEVRSVYPTMKWPADVRPDLDTLIKATAPADGEQVGRGFSHQMLAVVNTCAWYRSWDSAVSRGDTAAAGTALEAMRSLVTKYPPAEDKAGRQLVRDAATRAAAGDPALARDYVDANCFDTKWA